MAISSEYDGFYFLPGDEEGEMKFAFFDFKEDYDIGSPIEFNEIGDKYHLAFFKKGEDGLPKYDDDFEAILADPQVYITGLLGAEIYGCVLRKTENSNKWFQDYLTRTQKTVTIKKMTEMLQSIIDSK